MDKILVDNNRYIDCYGNIRNNNGKILYKNYLLKDNINYNIYNGSYLRPSINIIETIIIYLKTLNNKTKTILFNYFNKNMSNDFEKSYIKIYKLTENLKKDNILNLKKRKIVDINNLFSNFKISKKLKINNKISKKRKRI